MKDKKFEKQFSRFLKDPDIVRIPEVTHRKQVFYICKAVKPIISDLDEKSIFERYDRQLKNGFRKLQRLLGPLGR